jgi:hypothetical protein
MKRVVVGVFATAVMLCVAGRARAAIPPYAYTAKVFATVDAVAVQGAYVIVTGIVQGEEAPSTWAAAYSSSTGVDFVAACQRNALIAMAKPGQYLLEIQYLSSTSGGSVCKLSRATP